MAKRFSRGSKKSVPALAGHSLVAEFVAAMTNLSTAQTAHYVAAQTEQEALQTINYVGAGQAGPALARGTIPAELQQALVRSSLDAHLQKAQAQQIDDFAQLQLIEAEQVVRQKYLGKTVKVSIIDPAFQPVETYWWNENTGQYDQGTIKFKSIKGVIDELSLSQNRLILKPTLGSRLIIPNRKFVVIYVVNPDSLQPAVELSF